MAESRPFIFGSTTDSSSAAAQSNFRWIPKPQTFKTRLSRNPDKFSDDFPKFAFTSPPQSTEPVNISPAKSSTKDFAFSTQFPTNPNETIHGKNSLNSIDSASSFVGHVEESSSLPEPKQSLILVSRILKGMPQSPHFYQLRNFSELTRKSLISGWDQVFEETVEELHSLQVVDFWVKAKELWKTMEELQSMGYNVVLLRRRLVELTEVMKEFKVAQMEIKRLKTEAENHRLESSKLESIALKLQEMAEEEKEMVEKVVIEVAKKEDELPKFDAWFAKLTKDPL
ncbi:hypothetical protein CCACVL1_08215 [Corchorus capsularis]|uniref:Uncharacterized protein n=1 Tax=Corchorus capsularis TaxID=210143 RepID=A0A1R3J1P4_COCAP|nr:hypothetical protein CCACVL1_08215 [Corchorus capsularis]